MEAVAKVAAAKVGGLISTKAVEIRQALLRINRGHVKERMLVVDALEHLVGRSRPRN